jgi:hypothetical protein
MSAEIHPKKGRKSWKSGECLSDNGFRYDSLCRWGGGLLLLHVVGRHKDSTLMCYGGGHMGGINTLVNYVIGSGIVLLFEICFMVQYNALCVITDVVELGFKGRGFPIVHHL